MDEYRRKKVLVTGGLGFIGSNLAVSLVKSGASVTIVDSREPSCGANQFNIEPIKNDVEAVHGDVRDLDLMRKLVRDRDFVFSLAGSVSHIESMPVQRLKSRRPTAKVIGRQSPQAIKEATTKVVCASLKKKLMARAKSTNNG